LAAPERGRQAHLGEGRDLRRLAIQADSLV